MSIKDKLMNILIPQPRFVVIGIGLAITFVAMAAVGVTDNYQVFASGSGSTIREI